MTTPEQDIIDVLKIEPTSVDDIYKKLNPGKVKLSERIIKETILRLREKGIVVPNREWKMTLASKTTANNVD